MPFQPAGDSVTLTTNAFRKFAAASSFSQRRICFMQPVSRTSRYMNKALVAINFRMIKALVACRCRMAKVLVAGKFRSTSHHTVAHSYSTAVASSYCLPLQHIQALSQASVCFFFLTGAPSDTAFPVSRTRRSRANFASKFRKTTSLVASIFRMITALVASKFRMVKALIASKFRSTSHHNVDDLYPPAVASSYRLPSEHFRVLSRAPQRCLCCLPLPLNVAYRYTDALLTVHLLLVEIHFAMNRDDSTFGTPAQPATFIGAYHHIRICDFWATACEFFFGSTDASGDGKWASWQRTRASWWHTRAACRRHPRQRGGDLGRCSRSCGTFHLRNEWRLRIFLGASYTMAFLTAFGVRGRATVEDAAKSHPKLAFLCRRGEPTPASSAVAVLKAPAMRRRGPRRRDGHAVADWSATRRPRAGPASSHAAAAPSATQRPRHWSSCGASCGFLSFCGCQSESYGFQSSFGSTAVARAIAAASRAPTWRR